MIIEDGKGTGYTAQVDNTNLLYTKAVTETLLSHSSHEDGSAFGISTPMLTVTATGGRMLFIKNTSNSNNFLITDFWFNWNGGSTNYNRPCYGQLIFGDTQPTTNITTGAAGTLNRTANTDSELTVLYWNEVGDGMTGHVAGGVAFSWCYSSSPSYYHTGGAIILGNTNTLSVNLRGEEIGEASVNILGFVRQI